MNMNYDIVCADTPCAAIRAVTAHRAPELDALAAACEIDARWRETLTATELELDSIEIDSITAPEFQEIIQELKFLERNHSDTSTKVYKITMEF